MTEYITPYEARDMLRDLAPPFPTEEVRRDYGRLYAAAPDMARMIAGARVEYAVQFKNASGAWEFSHPEWDVRWQPDQIVQEIRAQRECDGETRIVRRLVIDLPEEDV